MKSKVFKTFAALLLTFATVFSFGACNLSGEINLTAMPEISNGAAGSVSKEYDGIGPEIKEPTDIDDPEHPEDKGSFKSYRMESESASHSLNGEAVAFDDNTNVRFSTLYSGCLVTSNLSKVGNVHTFEFESDKALSGVTLIINIAGAKDANVKLSDMIAVRMNGKSVNIKGLTVNYNDCVCLDPFTSAYSPYMNFKENIAFVKLEKGANKLEIEHVSVTGGNLDYVELRTSANITGFDNAKFWDSAAKWTVTVKPTLNNAGQIRMTKGTTTRDYVLPKLSLENGYTVTTVDEVTEYSFVLKGQKYSFVDDGVVIPDDEGPFTAYRMEAESAVHTQSGAPVSFDDNTNLRFSTLYSGCLVTSNLSAVGTVHTFNFNSDKALNNVKLVITISVPSGTANVKLSDMIAVRVNGEGVSLDGLVMNYNECTLLDPFTYQYSKYMYFKENELSISLKAGANKVEIEHVTTTGGNLDYVELRTSAVITGFDNGNFWDDSANWAVTKNPTLTATGTIRMTKGTATRDYVLPKLDEANGYTVTTVDDVTEYSFVLKGVKYAFNA